MKGFINRGMFILIMAFGILFSYHTIESKVKAYSFEEMADYVHSFSIRDSFVKKLWAVPPFYYTTLFAFCKEGLAKKIIFCYTVDRKTRK